jgi:two-component system, cell cycle sensor histidine kinase and response regulator CckA
MVVYDPMRDDLGAVDRIIVTICDITERKQAEASIHDSQNRLEFALESAQIGAWDLDLRDFTAFHSLQHARIFGYTELLPKWTYEVFLEHVLPEDRERVNEQFQRSLATKGDLIFECRIRRTDKQIRWIWVAGRQRLDETGAPRRIAGVIQDITERHQALEDRQKLESQIQHAQKLESLGILAGGIAHDFNNILTSILGYTDLALIELPNHSPARPWIAEAVSGACKAADLTKQMLAYSGKGKFVVQALNLNDVIEDMIHLLQVSISKKCVLKLHLMPDIPSIEADATQMRQVIMNLIINASDAIGERSGVIAITTGLMHCDRAYLSESYLDENLKEGLYVYMEVADTGCGMTEEIRTRIFDPFFTTKTTGRGLGLAAVLGIVRGHRGALKVYSETTRGTTFKVAFPAVNLPPQLDPSSGNTVGTWKGSGTVLVVDDEETVRGLLQHLLETMGFTVLTACDGREGVEVYRRESNTIRLVVLDMTMPHLDGAETFRELRRIRGDLKAILTSGYNEQSAISQFAGKGLSGFIQKPFRYDELLAIVRKVIDS